MTTIGLLNYATLPLPFTMQQLQAGLQEYAALLGPVWGVECEVVMCDDVPSLASGVWPLFLADTSNDPGAVAYHTLASTGQPWGVAFVKTALDNSDDPCVAVSHELAEMLVDPGCGETNRDAWHDYALEVCDPVQQQSFQAANGLALANFVYPAWFQLRNPAGIVGFDHMNLCRQSYQLLPGGYAAVFVRGVGWTNVFADAAAARRFAGKIGTADSRPCRRVFENQPG